MGSLPGFQEGHSRALSQLWDLSEHGVPSDGAGHGYQKLAGTLVLKMGPMSFKRQQEKEAHFLPSTL